MTNTHVIDVVGQAGDFTISLRQEPRYVDVDRCIDCGRCADVCPVELPDDYQQRMTTRKAAYKVAARATPDAYVIDRGPYCDACGKCVEVCPSHAINLNEQPRLSTVHVGAIVLALGFQVYDPTELEELGYGRYANVLSAMQYERLASRSGPTEGIVARRSDGQRPTSIAWLQCVGSRDQRNTFCSSICCMYATKEAILAKQRLGHDVECTVFIMDERAFNKEYHTYFANAREQHGIRYVRCRVSNVREDPRTRDLMVQYAAPDGQRREERFETVVLATGLQPPDTARQLADLLDIELNAYGFCETDKFAPLQTSRPGVFVCGAFSSPKEIVETIIDASGAAAEVMRLLNDQLRAHPYTREWPFLAADGLPPERNVANERPRVGVFACSCGSTIAQTIDLPALLNQAAKSPGVVYAETIDFACFPETLRHLQARIDEANLNRVVIAACSNRTHEAVFQRMMREAGLNPYLLELVNLREQCTWVHQGQRAQANRKAQELIRVAAGRVLASKPIHKDRSLCQPAALIIGGGVTGMTSALAIADSGYDVQLVERTDMLGGNLSNLYYVAEGYDPQRLLRDLVNRVRAHRRIAVHTRTEVIHHAGHVGNFQAELRTKYPDGAIDEFHIEHGVTIVATGGRETREHPWLKLRGVITQRELEEMIIHHPEKIAALQDVVMIQCVRPDGLPDYCSRVCCTNTMKNAIRIKLFNPACRVSVLYKNIVTYGFREEYYTEARQRGVVFIRYTDDEPPQVIRDGHSKSHFGECHSERSEESPSRSARMPVNGRDASRSSPPPQAARGGGPALLTPCPTRSAGGAPGGMTPGQIDDRDEGNRLVVRVRDLALNRWLDLPADLVPLSMSIAPAEGTSDLAKMLRVPITSEGFFQDAQLKLRPMDFMREGIFLAGMAHYPKFTEESISHALAAAARALTLLSQGSLHLGGVVAQVDPKKCVGCLTCTRVCPFAIPQVIKLEGRSGVGGLGGAAYIDPAQCQGCGTCTGECPANAIQLINYTDEQMMLRSIGGLGSWMA